MTFFFFSFCFSTVFTCSGAHHINSHNIVVHNPTEKIISITFLDDPFKQFTLLGTSKYRKYCVIVHTQNFMHTDSNNKTKND